MGVRPPPSNSDEGPDVIEFGIAEVAAELDGGNLSFPATGDEVVQALSNPRIKYDADGHTVPLSEAVSDVEREEFDDKQEFLNALHPVFEDLRESASNSILMQLRALVPF